LRTWVRGCKGSLFFEKFNSILVTVYDVQFRRIRVDGMRIRNKKFEDTNGIRVNGA
jgi:hypothetical protein